MSSKILIFLAKNQNLSAQILRQKRVPLSWILEKVLLWSMMLRMTVVLNLGSTPIHCYPVFLQRLFFCDFTICMYNEEKMASRCLDLKTKLKTCLLNISSFPTLNHYSTKKRASCASALRGHSQGYPRTPSDLPDWTHPISPTPWTTPQRSIYSSPRGR